jgi:hypothetical protein
MTISLIKQAWNGRNLGSVALSPAASVGLTPIQRFIRWTLIAAGKKTF